MWSATSDRTCPLIIWTSPGTSNKSLPSTPRQADEIAGGTADEIAESGGRSSDGEDLPGLEGRSHSDPGLSQQALRTEEEVELLKNRRRSGFEKDSEHHHHHKSDFKRQTTTTVNSLSSKELKTDGKGKRRPRSVTKKEKKTKEKEVKKAESLKRSRRKCSDEKKQFPNLTTSDEGSSVGTPEGKRRPIAAQRVKPHYHTSLNGKLIYPKLGIKPSIGKESTHRPSEYWHISFRWRAGYQICAIA